MTNDVAALARWIDEHWVTLRGVPEVLDHSPELSVEGAYAVQQWRIRDAVAAGDRVIGYKAALTTVAMQRKAGVDEPVLGTLLESQTVAAREDVALSPYMAPGIEPEVAVVIGERLAGPGVTAEDALQAVAGYRASIEIGDVRVIPGSSRSLQQTICCNAFNGGQLFGELLVVPDGIDLRTEGTVLTRNDVVIGSAAAVEVMGNPLNVVAFIANKLAQFDLALEPGMVCMTGSVVPSSPLAAGDHIRAEFTRIGSVEFTAAR